MRFTKVALAAMMLIGAPGITSVVYAQDSQCSCIAPLSSGTTGQIVFASGKVLSSQPLGLGDANAGAPISIGDQVVTGANSSAHISIGSCSIPIGANMEVMISEIGGDICVQTSEVATPPPSNALPVVLGLGAAGGIAGIAAIGGGDDGASP